MYHNTNFHHMKISNLSTEVNGIVSPCTEIQRHIQVYWWREIERYTCSLYLLTRSVRDMCE
jgi:hypothetical protein